MTSGLLTGSFIRERTKSLDTGYLRSGSPDYSGERLDRTLAPRGGPPAGRGPAQRLGRCDGNQVGSLGSGHTGAIVGARQPEQVSGWLPATELNLDEANLADIAPTLGFTRVPQLMGT